MSDSFQLVQLKRSRSVPSLIVRMRRLPTEWQHFVVDRFRKEAKTNGIPTFMELQKHVEFRCILNDLIEEVEDAYTVVPASPALRAGDEEKKN